MSYHYSECGLDNVWLTNGFKVEEHSKYGKLVSFNNVRGLHEAIARHLVEQPHRLTGAEFRFLRTELDMSQRVLGAILGTTDQAIAKWEKARDRPVANTPAERLMRAYVMEYLDDESRIRTLTDRLAKLGADANESEIRLEFQTNREWRAAA